MTDRLFILLIYASLFAIVIAIRAKTRQLIWFALAGLFCGLGSLTRTSMSGVTVLIALLSFLILLQRTQRPLQAVIGPILLIVTALVIIMPWTIRNYLVHDEFILISTKAGYNLYFYNFPSEDLRFNERLIPFPDLDGFDEPDQAKQLGELGLGFIRTYPTTFLKYALVKFADFWRPLPSSSNSSFIEQLFAIVMFTPVALVGLLGLFWSISDDDLIVREFTAFATGILGPWLIQAMVFTGGFKARIAIEPFLLIYAIYAVVRGFRHISSSRHNLPIG